MSDPCPRSWELCHRSYCQREHECAERAASAPAALAQAEPGQQASASAGTDAEALSEECKRLAWDARQAMLDYGRARVDKDDEAIKDSTTRACAAIDRLSALTREARSAAPAPTEPPVQAAGAVDSDVLNQGIGHLAAQTLPLARDSQDESGGDAS